MPLESGDDASNTQKKTSSYHLKYALSPQSSLSSSSSSLRSTSSHSSLRSNSSRFPLQPSDYANVRHSATLAHSPSHQHETSSYFPNTKPNDSTASSHSFYAAAEASNSNLLGSSSNSSNLSNASRLHNLSNSLNESIHEDFNAYLLFPDLSGLNSNKKQAFRKKHAISASDDEEAFDYDKII